MRCFLMGLFCCLLTVSAFGDEDDFQEELILSTPDQLAALACETDYLIGGLISPLSGHAVLRQTDLRVKGAQQIALTRIYTPPYMPSSFPEHRNNQEEYDKKHLHTFLKGCYQGWQFLPHLKLEFKQHRNQVRLSEPNGATFDFEIAGSKTTLLSPLYAVSNVAGDEPSGKYDPRNTRISYVEGGKKIVVYATDGAVRLYGQERPLKRDSWLYLLRKEVLPNGKILKYHYNQKQQPVYIESLDPLEKHVYASLHISGSPEEGNCHFLSSSGQTVDYSYQKRWLSGEIKEKHKWEHYKEKFNLSCPPILTSVSSPLYRHETLAYCDRFLLGHYQGKDHFFIPHHSGFGSDPHYRVHKLTLPVGQNDSFEVAYELNYQPAIPGKKEGETRVRNSDGTSTVYHILKNLLMASIQSFDQNGVLQKEKIYGWDDKSWLKSIEMKDGQGNLLHRKAYEYDQYGNPIVEIFTGDLTGSGTYESYTTRREFSQEGRNLLLREELENGKIVYFSYLPNTNLVTAKLTLDSTRIWSREFSVYDESFNLIETIRDDGFTADVSDLSGVTERVMTNYLLRQQAPFLHMPEWVEEKYVEQGTEKLLSRKHLVYDQHGNVAQEEMYDADGQLAYTIFKEYNERGDVISETNPMGQLATYGYDDRGRRVFATNFSNCPGLRSSQSAG